MLLVSGGTRGVGAAVAAAAARAGARVVVLGPEATADIGGATYRQCDVGDVSQARAAVAATVAANGRLDGLVNAAGPAGGATLLDTTPELLDRQLALTLRGPL
ncbi:MAG TPA: SDR family oxidoreductase, partial [Mycobacteriales bacterium]|nr:SDR family oxidoreductase [Mycobacteriales bacterium]